MCEKNCPTGSIDCKKGLVEQETCVKCLKCASSCPKGAIEFGFIKKEEEFNPKRREFLTLAGSLVLFSSAFIIARNYTQKTIKKLKNIILPAGAQDYQRFKDKCLNCNLCVNVCPNKIIKKADKTCGTIHIDYKEGKGFCKFDCRKCQEVCPSGAIKKTTLEEKQNTRIALGVVNDDCINCGICVDNCPKNAISKVNDKITINPSLCIGCNKCSVVCPRNAIQVFSINEQKTI